MLYLQEVKKKVLKRQNQSMKIEIRIVVACGGAGKGHKGHFWGK